MKAIQDLISGKPLIHVELSTDVRSAAKLMAEKNVGVVAVLDRGTLVGLFSERDLMNRVVARDLDPATTRIDDVMTREISAAKPADGLNECLEKMRSLNCRHLPVVDEGSLIGMISLRDLLQVENQSTRARANFLSDLVTYSPDYES